jgi:hypothetical protein
MPSSKPPVLWQNRTNGGNIARKVKKTTKGSIEMTRFFKPAAAGLLALGLLAGCSPEIPDSGAGVGFNDYNSYQQQQAARDAALTGNALPPPSAVSSETLPSAGGAPLGAAGAQTGALQASPSNPAPVLQASGISSENDFGAVSLQRSIEGDAALRAQNQQQYQVIQPTALPQRSSAAGPNIVAYALQARNAKGQSVYRRSSFNAQNKFARACAEFASPDQAQQAFLARGGPQKDRKGMDPDGDGFACAWDPAPFRTGVSG